MCSWPGLKLTGCSGAAWLGINPTAASYTSCGPSCGHLLALSTFRVSQQWSSACCLVSQARHARNRPTTQRRTHLSTVRLCVKPNR